VLDVVVVDGYELGKVTSAGESQRRHHG